MTLESHNKLVSFIWNIADDCLRDVYNRGKYRDVILPMIVLRRLDALLEPTKEEVLEEAKFQKEEVGLSEFDPTGFIKVTGYVFYNTSKWTLTKIYQNANNNKKDLENNLIDYLNGFSSNVQEIVRHFSLKQQITKMNNSNILLDVLERFISPKINLTPESKVDPDGRMLPALTNLGMGYVFEELIRRFNEENNEEAGEHFTPREVIELMIHLVFDPIKDKLPSVMTVYDPACGSGGMLTEAQNFIKDEEGAIKAIGDVYLFGKESQPETYAICKSDMMIKGNSPENIRLGSTLATDEFAGKTFDFMLSNPPYGKSWNSDVKHIKDGKDIIDSRFTVKLKNFRGIEEDCDATPRTSDGQLLFLMEMVSKMKPVTSKINGSRIASVHNGSSLFTGDAGSGESNIRRYILENDLLSAIVQMPNNLFYNTGISTYLWILSNNKPEKQKGKVLLIDASQRFEKLRKNLGNKNCEFTPDNIQEILKAYLDFNPIDSEDEKDLRAKVFDNTDFSYHKVVIERPKRLKAQITLEKIEGLRYDNQLEEPMRWAYGKFGEAIYSSLKDKLEEIFEWCDEQDFELTPKKKAAISNIKTWTKGKELYEQASKLLEIIGQDEYSDFNAFDKLVAKRCKENDLKLSSAEKKAIYGVITWYDEEAEKVIKKKQKLSQDKINELCQKYGCEQDDLSNYGYFRLADGQYTIYETESDLRDFEQIPVKQDIEEYFIAEVKPHIQEAWMDLDKTKIGCEISFNKYFYRHKPLRELEEVTKEIIDLELASEGLIKDILNLT